MVTTISDNLPAFTGAKEGYVSKAYKDSGGVITIGHGFTWGSKIFATYWMATRGHKLKMGDTITLEESLSLLKKTLAEEYAPPVLKRFGPNLPAHQFDGSADYSYNCGPGGLKDSWTALLAAGRIAEAAARLRTSRITARGKQLAGLVNRRAAEGRLIEKADYGFKPDDAISTGNDAVREYQTDLKTLGYYTGAVDGYPGPKTSDAVMAFQRANGLVVDGKVGPATRSAIARALAKRAANLAGVTAAPSAAAVSPVSASPEPASWALHAGLWALAAVVIVIIGFVIWQNRGRILGKRTPT